MGWREEGKSLRASWTRCGQKSLEEREILNSIKFWRILILYSPFPTLTIH